MGFFIVSALVVLLDQATKAVVIARIPRGEVIDVIGSFVRLTHVRNAGAAFGMLQERQALFIGATAAVALLILIFRNRIPKLGWPIQVGLALAFGGAVGNLIDRLRYGNVVDFLEVAPFPIFNLADGAIVVGVALILIGIMRDPGRKED